MKKTNEMNHNERLNGPDAAIPTGLVIPEPEKILLDNGIPVFLFHGCKQEVCVVHIVFFSGTSEQNQILQAGFTVSMLKEGTRTKNASEIASFFDYHGASTGFRHGKHEVSITLASTNRVLEKVLPQLSDIILNPVFPEKELELLKSNRKQDFISENKRVDVACNKLFLKNLYGVNHPYGKTAEAEDFDLVRKDWLVDFAGTHFHTANCAIIVAGNIPAFLPALLNTLFAEMPGGVQIQRTSSIVVTTKADTITEEREDAVQSAVITGTSTINRTHPDFIKLTIANTLLGGFFGSRLMKNIREDKGYTYGIYSRAESSLLTGTFSIFAETGTDYTAAVVDEIRKELQKMHEQPANHEELDLLKRYLSGTMIRNFDGVLAASEMFRTCLPYNINYGEYYKELMQTLERVTAEELAKVSGQYLNPDQMLNVVVGKR